MDIDPRLARPVDSALTVQPQAGPARERRAESAERRLPPEVAQRVPLAQARAVAKVAAAAPAGPAAGRLLRAAQSARTRAQRTIWLHRFASAWIEPLERVAPCRRGCAHCCHLPVVITSAEAELIGRASGRPPVEPAVSVSIADIGAPENIARAQALARRAAPTPCPFLADGACSVYASRPFACRTHLTLDDDELLCRLIEGIDVPVPYADARALWPVHLSAHAGERLADVREFFPEEESPGRGASVVRQPLDADVSTDRDRT
jgi:Fe-S-cluster containining protein